MSPFCSSSLAKLILALVNYDLIDWMSEFSFVLKRGVSLLLFCSSPKYCWWAGDAWEHQHCGEESRLSGLWSFRNSLAVDNMAEERMACRFERLSANPLRYKSCSYLKKKKKKGRRRMALCIYSAGISREGRSGLIICKDKDRRETVTRCQAFQ